MSRMTDQLRVEDADLAVEDQRARRQARYRLGDIREPRGVIMTAPTDQADVATVLDDGDAPAVDFSS